MTTYKYSYNGEQENIGKAVLKDLDISTKHSIEICSRIRNKTVEQAKKYLESVKKMETPVKFTRFTAGAGHKTGMGSGKYPLKAATEILKAINSAESNANDKGLTGELKIIHVMAQRGTNQWKYGRQKRRKAKRTHLEIIVKEITPKKKTDKIQPKISKQENKQEHKEKSKEEQKKKEETSTKAETKQPEKSNQNQDSTEQTKTKKQQKQEQK